MTHRQRGKNKTSRISATRLNKKLRVLPDLEGEQEREEEEEEEDEEFLLLVNTRDFDFCVYFSTSTLRALSPPPLPTHKKVQVES